MTVMAILQDVDKCMRCNGCTIACKRTWQMKAETKQTGNKSQKVAYDQRVAIKSQKRVDMGPFVRFSCWHCSSPPCAPRCPKQAVKKHANGAVYIDPTACDPMACDLGGGRYPCNVDCQRGGYPKVGPGSDAFTTDKAWKCTLCHGRAGANADLDSAYGAPLPTRKKSTDAGYVADMAHEPACVYTCPAKAMKWDTRANIVASLTGTPGNGYISAVGNGSMFWASKKSMLVAPKADPFVEDHVAPMVSSILSGPFAKAALVPALIAGGFLAFSARRAENEEASTMSMVGEV